METDLRSFALKSTLNEVRNLCPDINSVFVFTEDGEITASDESTPEKSMVRIVDALNGLLEKAETVGGIELVTIEGSRGGASLCHLSNQYLVTVTSEDADENVNMITRSIVTTVLKLLEKISPTPLRTSLSETIMKPEEPVGKEEESVEQPGEKPEMRETEHAETTVKPENTQPQLVANQFIVENVQGMLVAADTVRVDRETLQQWEEHGNRKVEKVEVETFGGQSTRCKIKPIKDSKLEGKGVIQVPQKIQRLLGINKGELVKVKPLAEHEGDGS
jgi:hypothetical protein